MPASISIVIPTLNAARHLAGSTNTLLEGVTDGLVSELVISDGGSTDETRDAARELGAVWVEGPPGRGRQLARGVAAAKSSWVLLLHADTWLSAGWPAAAARHMNAHPESAGWFRLKFRADGVMPRLVEYGANRRARILGLPYGDQGLLITQKLLADVGGIPDLPLMEDVALARRLKGKLRPLAAEAMTSAERYERDGWFRRPTQNIGTLMRYFMGADPQSLKQRYERKARN